ncbi:MAG: hypothetical protein K0R17_2987 [Rariglobus sp.]|jgi:hypothetical protein|nr:hypothetical protein [Rariglobus sp.]
MSVVPLTLTISLCLVFTFVLFFLREHSRRRFSGAESEALLPLAEETSRVVMTGAGADAAAPKVHDHGPGHACRGNGTCASCERRAQRSAAASVNHA